MTTYREHVEAAHELAHPMEYSASESWSAVYAQRAQVHATLALAEQQRISNLLKIAAEGRHAMEKNAGESWAEISDALGIGDSNE